METLRLSFGSQYLRSFPIRENCLEIGANLHCDIVIHDPGIRPRHALVERVAAGMVRLVTLDTSGHRDGRGEVWKIGSSKTIGMHHSLILQDEATVASRVSMSDPRTIGVTRQEPNATSSMLVVGRGPEARRHAITRTLHIGSAPGNDIVLEDRAVSAFHMRIERASRGVRVRDLGSRNGTWLNGSRVDRAYVTLGAQIVVGKTQLHVVPSEEPGAPTPEHVVAVSASMLQVLADVDRYAALDWPVLVHGESGAGKEALARRLHERSARAAGPYVVLNAACVPRELIESELFGHERGAFTGAVQGHAGVFEQADGGTLFLDEVGELAPEMQSRLLRVLESWEVRRVGASRTKRVNVRLVCATHRDLRAMVERGSFRLDLYYRLVRLMIEVPPLRQRREDIAPLCEHFLRLIASDLGPRQLSAQARARLMRYEFPGNARELRNVLGVAALSASAGRIEAADIESALASVSGVGRSKTLGESSLRGALQDAGGNLSAAARSLGVPRSTLRDRLRASEPPTDS